MEQASIGRSLFAQTSSTAPSTTTLGAPAGKFALVCHSGPTPSPYRAEPGDNRVQVQRPRDFSCLAEGQEKENSNCQIACVDPHRAGQDGQENVARRRPPPAARHRRSLFVPPLHGGDDAAHRFGPKLWENVLLLSAKLGFSRCQPAAFPLSGPSSSVWTLAQLAAHGTWWLLHASEAANCPRGTCLFPAFHIVYPPGRSRLKHARGAGVVVV